MNAAITDAAVAVARKVGETMFAVDNASKDFMQMELLTCEPGRAAGCSIEFLKPAHLGDVLICEGIEQTLQGRHGIYDMKVTNQRHEVIAMFRGKSAHIQGTVVPV